MRAAPWPNRVRGFLGRLADRLIEPRFSRRWCFAWAAFSVLNGFCGCSAGLIAEQLPPPSGSGAMPTLSWVNAILAVCGAVTGLSPYLFKELSERRKERLAENERKLAEANREIATLRGQMDELMGIGRRTADAAMANRASVAAAAGKQDASLEALRAAGIFGDPAAVGALPKLLQVEDDPNLTRAFSRFFTERGFNFDHTAFVTDAIAKVTGPDPPDWVILDLKLGSADGLDVLRAVRENNVPVGVVVLTGTPDPVRLEQARALGPDALLVKGQTSPDELIEAFRAGRSPRPEARGAGP